MNSIAGRVVNFHSLPELGTEDGREGLNRDEEVLSGRSADGVVRGQTPARYDVVYVGMVAHIAPPCMQCTHHSNLSADEPGIYSQFLKGR